VTGRHHRGTPLIRLLARLGWQRDPDGWTVPCRDLDGRRARLLVRLAPTGITLTPTAPGPLRLTVLQVGQLRGAARDAIYTVGLLADPDHAEPAQARHPGAGGIILGQRLATDSQPTYGIVKRPWTQGGLARRT
jgi:hypothetical protein